MLLPQVEQSVFETILARRSVRSYSSQQVDKTTVRTLLEAAVRAPTAMHKEPWAFLVIQDKQILQNLSDRAKPLFLEKIKRNGTIADVFNHLDSNIFYDAGTLIIICCRANESFSEADCWLAAENLMLAACAMGLGSCVIGCALPALNIQEIKTSLGIPAEFMAVAPIIIGYPSGKTPPSGRKAPLIFGSSSITTN